MSFRPHESLVIRALLGCQRGVKLGPKSHLLKEPLCLGIHKNMIPLCLGLLAVRRTDQVKKLVGGLSFSQKFSEVLPTTPFKLQRYLKGSHIIYFSSLKK